MKNFTFISIIVLSLQFVNVQASGGEYTCENFTGTISGLSLNPDACAIVTKAKIKYFPEIDLKLFPFGPGATDIPLCFTGNLDGQIGGIEGTSVRITTNSAITENYMTDYILSNSLDLYDVTAVTALTIYDTNDKVLGTVYTQDTLLDPPPFLGPVPTDKTREYLTVVGGSQQFQQAKGRFVIEGDAISGADVTGKLCILGSFSR
jgi:hypothetical protein